MMAGAGVANVGGYQFQPGVQFHQLFTDVGLQGLLDVAVGRRVVAAVKGYVAIRVDLDRFYTCT